MKKLLFIALFFVLNCVKIQADLSVDEARVTQGDAVYTPAYLIGVAAAERQARANFENSGV